MAFQFEQLDVYKLALDWVETVASLCADLKGKVSNTLLDQLSRASMSVPLNIAEGNGRWHKPDKRQFFWMARGSVFECVPILQVLHRKKLLEGKAFSECYNQLDRMAKMLCAFFAFLNQDNRYNLFRDHFFEVAGAKVCN